MARRRRQNPAQAPASARTKPVLLPTAAATAAAAAAAVAEREREIANQAELRANAYNVLSAIHMARPKNTIKEYRPKQIEFTRFCERKQYQDHDTVTEDKLLLFLQECVVNRPLRTKSRTADDSILQGETRLAWRSVRGYVTAVTDL